MEGRVQHERGTVEEQPLATRVHQQQGNSSLKRGLEMQEQQEAIDLTGESDDEPEVEVLD
jgi:hypothetical protein